MSTKPQGPLEIYCATEGRDYLHAEPLGEVCEILAISPTGDPAIQLDKDGAKRLAEWLQKFAAENTDRPSILKLCEELQVFDSGAPGPLPSEWKQILYAIEKVKAND